MTPDSFFDNRSDNRTEIRADIRQDARIAWCREHIAGFREMHDQALRARRDTEESRRQLASHVPAPAFLSDYAAQKAERAA